MADVTVAFIFNGNRYEWTYATDDEADAFLSWAATSGLVEPIGRVVGG